MRHIDSHHGDPMIASGRVISDMLAPERARRQKSNKDRQRCPRLLGGRSRDIPITLHHRIVLGIDLRQTAFALAQ
jgi:hypothetical protein